MYRAPTEWQSLQIFEQGLQRPLFLALATLSTENNSLTLSSSNTFRSVLSEKKTEKPG